MQAKTRSTMVASSGGIVPTAQATRRAAAAPSAPEKQPSKACAVASLSITAPVQLATCTFDELLVVDVLPSPEELLALLVLLDVELIPQVRALWACSTVIEIPNAPATQ
ncbi:MAG: hypothetical protein AB7U18_21370, partial [Dehalococcoidia bacterium]